MNDRDAPPGAGRFLTLADTADILALTVSQVRALVRTGELPAIRISQAESARQVHWRVERVVLESFIEARYEEARRVALWEQSDFANIPELSGGTIIRPGG
jgi:hypothetical protein